MARWETIMGIWGVLLVVAPPVSGANVSDCGNLLLRKQRQKAPLLPLSEPGNPPNAQQNINIGG
jgi:hypothetical protein